MDGLSTIGTILKMGAQSSSLTEVPDLQDFPDLMGAPDKIETTTMKNTSRTYIPGLKDPGDMAFNFLYSGMGEGSNYATLKAAQDSGATRFFQLVFPDKSGFAWEGRFPFPSLARASARRCSSQLTSRPHRRSKKLTFPAQVKEKGGYE